MKVIKLENWPRKHSSKECYFQGVKDERDCHSADH